METLLTIGQVARIAGVKPQFIYGLCKKKKLPFVRVGERIMRVRPEDLAAFLQGPVKEVVS